MRSAVEHEEMKTFNDSLPSVWGGSSSRLLLLVERLIAANVFFFFYWFGLFCLLRFGHLALHFAQLIHVHTLFNIYESQLLSIHTFYIDDSSNYYKQA